jgi:hypothetical protein
VSALGWITLAARRIPAAHHYMVLRRSKKCEQAHMNYEELDVPWQAPRGVVDTFFPADFKVKPVKRVDGWWHEHVAADEISEIISLASNYFGQ